MKFNCGSKKRPTKQELAALYDQRIKDAQQWVMFFAWLPVRMGDGTCRWLERVERRVSPEFAAREMNQWVFDDYKADYCHENFYESLFWRAKAPLIEYRPAEVVYY